MNARIVVLAGFLLAGWGAPAQDWAKAKLEKSPRHGEWVDVKSGARTVRCFIVYPEVKRAAPGVIVIHEIFGMTDWVRDLTDQVAAAGCIAIAPDLLSGMGPKGGGSSDFASVDDVRGAISKLPADQITADLNAVADYLKGLPSANGKLAVIGFCWGGGQTFRFACDRSDLKAACVFYGPPPDAEAMAKIRCPVYGFYGGNDNRITSTVAKTQELMRAVGEIYVPVTYVGAGHGFMRAGEQPGAEAANKKAHDKAWMRLKSILTKL
jgi:carboxymethylenebutenolidase